MAPSRQVVFKGEALAQSPNAGSVVIIRTDRPLVVYDRYIDCCESEQWIGDFKLS